MQEYSLDQVNIPRMYFQEQSADFTNKRNYLSQEYKRLTTAASTQENTSAGPAPKRTNESAAANEPTKRLRNS